MSYRGRLPLQIFFLLLFLAAAGGVLAAAGGAAPTAWAQTDNNALYETEHYEAGPDAEPVSGDVQGDDPVKGQVLRIMNAVKGRTGDVIILVTLILTGVAIWKKMYRASVGIFLLGLGVVLVRVTISFLFD